MKMQNSIRRIQHHGMINTSAERNSYRDNKYSYSIQDSDYSPKSSSPDGPDHL